MIIIISCVIGFVVIVLIVVIVIVVIRNKRKMNEEETMEETLNYDLQYTDEARRMMDARMILTDDVIAVLNDYRETGEAVLDLETGLLVARKRIGNATFWVKFIQEGENHYLVHSAYSHRMRVVKREG